MPHRILDVLRYSDLVEKVTSVDFDGIGDFYKLKIRAQLKNEWMMDIWEHKTPGLRRYSFHVFHKKRMIVRWDNSPHFKGIKTFPHHQHFKGEILESKEMTIELVLKELKKMIENNQS